MREFTNQLPELNGKSILITGGTGSFGKAFVEAVLERWTPNRLVIYSRDEMKQWEMSIKPPFKGHPALRFFIGDVRDRERLEMALRGIDIVIHAAALKHVPAAEYNPFECIHTNVLGAENVVRASIAAGVKQVVALSTDKAANPANLYGASKLASDKIFVAANNLAGTDGPKFCVVRYGNVVGSRGSVVPFFRGLLRDGATRLPITDARMTRFWITLPQGVNFVLSSLATMEGGEIFVPKIPSMSVVDLAQVLAPDLDHEIVGIRPGEKLHEVMVTPEDALNTFDLGDRYVIRPAFHFWTSDGPKAGQGTPVGEAFSYASDSNTEWLTSDDLRAMLDSVPEDK